MFLPTSPRPPSGTMRRTLSDMPASVTAVLFRPTRSRRVPRAGDSTGRRASGTPDSPFRGLFADRRSRENVAMRLCLRPPSRLVPAILALVAALVVAAPAGAGRDQRHPVTHVQKRAQKAPRTKRVHKATAVAKQTRRPAPRRQPPSVVPTAPVVAPTQPAPAPQPAPAAPTATTAAEPPP